MGKKYIPGNITKCKCSFGATPCPIVLVADHGVFSGPDNQPLANINDHMPIVNLATFGVCKMIPNMPMPCIPITPLAWMMGDKKYIIDGAPALTKDSKLTCMKGGIITIS